MIVLDTNILIPAVLGRRVRQLLEDHTSRAAALGLACEVWTEDSDFFGTGIAFWTTKRIEIFLRQQATSAQSPEE